MVTEQMTEAEQEALREQKRQPIDPNMDWGLLSVSESNRDEEYELIDQDTYTVELTQVGQPFPSPYDPNGKKMRTRLVFTVVDDEDWGGYEVSKEENLSMHERSNFFQIVKALMGGELDPTVRYTPAMILHKRMKAAITHSDPDSNGRVWARLGNAMPIRERRGRQQQPQQELLDDENAPF